MSARAPSTPSPGVTPPRLPVGDVTESALRAGGRRVTPPEVPRWRRIARIAWPVVLANALQSVTLTVDLAFVGALGAGAMAVAGFSTQVYFLALSLAMGVSAGATALVARHYGAGDADGADRATWTVLVTTFAVGFLVAGLMVAFAGPLVRVISGDSPIAEPSRSFLVLLAAGLPGHFVIAGLTGAFQGAGDTRPTLVVGVLVNVVNLFLDWLLIFGNWGAPALGFAGAAVATASAFTMGGVLFLAILMSGRRPLRLRAERLRPGAFARLARVGAPAGAEAVLLSVGFTGYLVLILNFGPTAIAAHQIGLRVQSFAFLPGFGLAAAAAALVGQGLGAGTPRVAEADGWGALKFGLTGMMLVSVPLGVLADPVARVFTQEPEAVALGATWIRVLVVAMPALAAHFTIAGALRGAGDTRWPLLVSFIGLWVVRLPLAWALAFPFGLGLMGLWVAYILEYYGRAAATLLRFRGGRWKTLKV